MGGANRPPIIIPSVNPDEGYLAEIEWIGHDFEKAELTLPLNYSPEKDEHGEIIYVDDMELRVPLYAMGKRGPVPVVTINLRSREEMGTGIYKELEKGPFNHLEWWPGTSRGPEIEIDTIYLQDALEHVGKKYESKVTLSPAIDPKTRPPLF